MIEFIILGALLALIVFKLGQWYQRHRWITEMVEDTEHWQGLLDLVKREKAKMTPEERATLKNSKEDNAAKESVNIEKHGSLYYAFTFNGDEFIAQAPTIEELANEIERRRPGRFNVGDETKIAK